MTGARKIGFLLCCLGSFQYSCTTLNITNYYANNKIVLDSIQLSYKEQYRNAAFSVEFSDKAFNHVSLEIITDSFKYIYEFEISEKRLMDTLSKYNINIPRTKNLINQMKSIRCIWINNLDYYLEGEKQTLVFMSIRPKPFTFPFTNKKYYILTYFAQPQYYDKEGRLLDHRKRKKLRKINEDEFKRINEKVAYTISDRYR